ncbi:MAG TPA: hypothetical protein VFG50_01485, partial [Rhodothermales bacterium]|nr:hypothetical protein [Rhodothermales bacterium]
MHLTETTPEEHTGVIVLGRFPPPLDGQSLATRRLAAMLSGDFDVHTLDLSAASEHTEADIRFRWSRVRHYLSLRERLQAGLQRYPDSPVLWTSISPTPLGHIRDLLVTAPAFGRTRPVLAVVHWGNFDQLFRHPLTRASALRLAHRISIFVFLDPSLAAACAPWIPENRRTSIPNTIDADVLCTPQEVQAKQEHRKQRTSVRLLFLSNMIPEKGYLDALHA